MRDKAEAYQLLLDLGATERLLQHARLVSETADRLLQEFDSVGIALDVRLVEVGAVLHDTGKVQCTEELSEPGTLHEEAGQAILLSREVEPEVARFCVAHAQWELPGTTIEERIVALADNLWKGKREERLELIVIDEAARRMRVERWDLFERLDSAFERIAADGAARIEETRSSSQSRHP